MEQAPPSALPEEASLKQHRAVRPSQPQVSGADDARNWRSWGPHRSRRALAKPECAEDTNRAICLTMHGPAGPEAFS